MPEVDNDGFYIVQDFYSIPFMKLGCSTNDLPKGRDKILTISVGVTVQNNDKESRTLVTLSPGGTS